METTTTLWIVEGAIVALFFVLWIRRAILQHIEDRRFWREIEARLKQQEEEFYAKLFNALLDSPEFIAFMKKHMYIKNAQAENKERMKDLISGTSTWNQPEAKPKTRFQRFKQWVINIF